MVPTIVLYIAGKPIFCRIDRYNNKYHQSSINDAFYENGEKLAAFCLTHDGGNLAGMERMNHVAFVGKKLKISTQYFFVFLFVFGPQCSLVYEKKLYLK